MSTINGELVLIEINGKKYKANNFSFKQYNSLIEKIKRYFGYIKFKYKYGKLKFTNITLTLDNKDY
jgi:hypothetical protein